MHAWRHTHAHTCTKTRAGYHVQTHYAFMLTHMHVHTPMACVHAHTGTDAYMRTCNHKCANNIHASLHSHTHAQERMRTNTHTCICIIGVYSHAHMHVHIHRNECTCTCMHVHACARALTHHDTHNCAFTTTAYGPPQICCGRTSAIWIKPSVTLTGNEWGFRTKRNASLLT